MRIVCYPTAWPACTISCDIASLSCLAAGVSLRRFMLPRGRSFAFGQWLEDGLCFIGWSAETATSGFLRWKNTESLFGHSEHPSSYCSFNAAIFIPRWPIVAGLDALCRLIWSLTHRSFLKGTGPAADYRIASTQAPLQHWF